MYASATGLKRMVMEGTDSPDRAKFLERVGRPAEDISPKEMAEAARAGDDYARELFRRYAYYLGLGLASIVNVLGIHTIVIGGGVSQSWDLFIKPLQKEFARRSYDETVRITQFLRAKLGEDAGIIGAAHGAADTPLHPLS